MGSFYMEATQINYRRDETLKTVDQKLQELSEESAVDTDIAPVFSKTATYNPGDLVYYKNKLYVCVTQHNGAWAAADFTASTVAAEVSSLRSGLTNYEANTNAALALPDGTGKNIFPLSFAKLKAANALVSWVDNTYTFRSVTFTVTTNASGYVTNINVSGTAEAGDDCVFPLANADSPNPMEVGQYILNGCPATGGGTNTYRLRIGGVGSDNGSGYTFTVSAAGNKNPEIVVKAGYELPTGGVDFKPMIRPATITDSTFAPYIPSVESRIEAVESVVASKTVTTYNDITVSANSKKFVDNIGSISDGHMYTVLCNNSDCIGYVSDATNTVQAYIRNMASSSITTNVRVVEW